MEFGVGGDEYLQVRGGHDAPVQRPRPAPQDSYHKVLRWYANSPRHCCALVEGMFFFISDVLGFRRKAMFSRVDQGKE